MSDKDSFNNAPQKGIEKSVDQTFSYKTDKLLYSLDYRAANLDFVRTYFWKEIESTANLEEDVTVFLKNAETLWGLEIFRIKEDSSKETLTGYTTKTEVKNWTDTEPREPGYNITISWIKDSEIPVTQPDNGSTFKIKFVTKDNLEKVKLSSSRFLLDLSDVKENILSNTVLFVKYTTKIAPLIDNGKPVTDH